MQQEPTQTGSQRSDGYQPIEDYAIIGDLHTVALVGKNGSIDWCCIPRFDSPSVFGALLDANKGGFFRVAPCTTLTTAIRYKHLYLPETNVLLTRFLTVDGVGELIDFMPIKREDTATHQHHIIRALKVVRGSLPFEITCRPAFNYAQDAHTVTFAQNGAIFRSETLCLGLDSSIPLEEDGQGGVHATFTLHANQWAYFVLESIAIMTWLRHILTTNNTNTHSMRRSTTGNIGSHNVSTRDAGEKWSNAQPWRSN